MNRSDQRRKRTERFEECCGIFQFPHIPRPVISPKNFFLTVRYFLIVRFRKEAEQRQNIVFSGPQRRNFQRDHAEPVKKIFPEFSLGDHLFQILVGGSDDTDIDIDDFIASDPHNLFFLQYTEKSGLESRRNVTNLI